MSFICYHSGKLVFGQKMILVPAVKREVKYVGINRKFRHLYDENLYLKPGVDVTYESSSGTDGTTFEPLEKTSLGWEVSKEVPVSQDNLAAFLATGFTAQVLPEVKEVRYVF